MGRDVWLVVVLVGVLLATRKASAAMTGRAASFIALAESIAVAEGFGLAGAVPTVRNNPGDMKGSNGQVKSFETVTDGWDALYHQLDLMRTGTSAYYSPDMTLWEVSRVWTTTQQDGWLSNVVQAMHDRGYPVTTQTTLSEIL